MALFLRCHCGLSSSSSSSHLRKQPLSEVTLGGEGRRVTSDSPKEKEKSMEVPKKWSFCANDLAISRVSPLRFVGEKSSNNPFALSYSTPLWRNGPFGFNRHPPYSTSVSLTAVAAGRGEIPSFLRQLMTHISDSNSHRHAMLLSPIHPKEEGKPTKSLKRCKTTSFT